MDKTKTVDFDVPEFQDNSTSPSARFLEYVRYSEQLRKENNDVDSTEGD